MILAHIEKIIYNILVCVCVCFLFSIFYFNTYTQTQRTQFVNIFEQTDITGGEGLRLKASMLVENNQSAPQCLVKR